LSFAGINDLVDELQQNGYYGGTRLIKATIKVFGAHCKSEGLNLPAKNFTITYRSDIPGRLGLAGSSAIVTAALKALMEFYKVDIPNPVLANLALSAEKDELHIGAGLQDRVAQVYNQPVFMDFNKALIDKQGFGQYIPFDKSLLPKLYIAYSNNLSEGSEVTHNDLAGRYAKSEPAVLKAVEEWSALTGQVWERLQQGDKHIGDLLNRNFDIRRQLLNIGAGNLNLVETARSTGASAKFTGSGGAIIGTYENDAAFAQLCSAMDKINAVVLRPEL
jgi:glucuronokinase